MEAKLADYRAKKKAEQEALERKSKLWDLITFKSWRNEAAGVKNEENGEPVVEELPWTRLDYAILCVKLVMWVVGQVLFVKLEFGAVYFATSVFAFIWLNLGQRKRKEGELSAYSVFNPNCQTIQGTLTAEQFESEIRHRKI